MIRKFEFKIYDLKTNNLISSMKGNKGEADRFFVETQKHNPTRKLHMKMGEEIK